MDDIDRAFGPALGFYVGVDFGQVRDFSAVVVCRKHIDRYGDVYNAIVFTHRYKLGLSYPALAVSLADFVAQLPELPDPPMLFCDQTGLGRPVLDCVREQGLNPIGVNLTSGANWSFGSEPRTISLPKSIMVSTLNVAFQSGLIGLAADLTELTMLQRELAVYQIKRTANGTDTFNANASNHDDLVVALGLGVFGASRNWKPARSGIIL